MIELNEQELEALKGHDDNHVPEYRAYWDDHYRRFGEIRGATDQSPEDYREYYLYELRTLFGDCNPESVFDYGCGSALMKPIINELWPNANYEGGDISITAVNFARSKFPDCNFFDLYTDHPNAVYDLILCHSVFTHVFRKDGEDLLKTLNKLLKTGGVMSVSIQPTDRANYIGNIHSMGIDDSFFREILNSNGFIVDNYLNLLQRYFRVTKVKECE